MPLIDPTLLQPLLGPLAGRFDVDSVDECDSTSSEIQRRADRGAPSGTVVVADAQTAGRGRRGRSWLSSPQGSLTFSLLWRFPGPATRLAGLSLAVGVALARGLESLGAKGIALKWPNDVLVRLPQGDAKVAGVLVELASDRRGTQAVIGIGINLSAPGVELPQPAAGLDSAFAAVPERHALLAALLAALAVVLDAFGAGGFAALQAEWQRRHGWAGAAVQVEEDGVERLAGVCRGADTDGALLIETPAGLVRILSGDLTLRRS